MGAWEDALKDAFDKAKAKADMPAEGELPGKVFLNPKLAPQVPGNSRPFAPGEYVKNPSGSWSSEISVTVQDPRLNGGKPTIVPSLWLKDGKPVRVSEDQAVEEALASGLQFQSFKDIPSAEDFANKREQQWQKIKPEEASKIAPLWTPPTPQIQ